MVQFPELDEQGWTLVTGINTQSDLLELARSIGRPLPTPTGELIKVLTPTPQANARRATLSKTYGTGAFPLHTDTAFWPVPSRYVVLRANGDTRRDTTILTFTDLIGEGPEQLSTLIDRSVWRVRTPSARFYCSMRFRCGRAAGWRYDAQCMIPVNSASANVQEILNELISRAQLRLINWTGDVAAVLCNWHVLHGRGAAPPNEGNRILERVYVG